MAEQTKQSILYRIILWLIPALKQELAELHSAIDAIPAVTYETKLEALAKDIMPTVPALMKVEEDTGKQVQDDEARIKRAFALARAWLAEVHA